MRVIQENRKNESAQFFSMVRITIAWNVYVFFKNSKSSWQNKRKHLPNMLFWDINYLCNIFTSCFFSHILENKSKTSDSQNACRVDEVKKNKKHKRIVWSYDSNLLCKFLWDWVLSVTLPDTPLQLNWFVEPKYATSINECCFLY